MLTICDLSKSNDDAENLCCVSTQKLCPISRIYGKNLNLIFSPSFTKNTYTIHLCWIIQQKDSRLILHVYVVIHQSQKIPYFFLKIAIWHETFWQAFMLGQFLFCRMSLTFNIWTTRSYSLNFKYSNNKILISLWTTTSYSLNWEDPKLSIY